MYSEPATWVVVYETADPRLSAEAALVLTALEIDHDLTRLDGNWQLSVAAVNAARAGEELAAYDRERSAPRVGPQPIAELGTGWNGVIAYGAVLVFFAILPSQGVLGTNWFSTGRLDAGRVVDGEWWRAVTALTLHADLGHLASNIVFGGFFGLYVGRYLGAGAGWAAILAGGVIGNLVNAGIQPASHLAIGASTSVFAALGLLSAYTWRRGFFKNTPWRERIAPVTAAIFLLAFTGTGTGTGSDNVDVMAHLTGFVSGFGIGVWLAASRLPEGERAQRIIAIASAGFVVVSWLTAFNAAAIYR
jgi:membrane associated rhomboid family serine protease